MFLKSPATMDTFLDLSLKAKWTIFEHKKIYQSEIEDVKPIFPKITPLLPLERDWGTRVQGHLGRRQSIEGG